MKLSIINYGLPFVFNPDENYILKEPFKLIYLYSNLIFSETTNLFYWFSTAWWGLVFIAGWIAGKWHTLLDFQNMIISEDPAIFYLGRLLSIILSTLAGLFLFKIVELLKEISFTQRLLFFLILIFNPIDIFSNVWIKYDAAVYLFSCLLLYVFILRQSQHRNFKITDYILVFAGISVRIDLVLFLVIFLLVDLLKNGKINLRSFPFKGLLAGTIIFMFISMMPFVWLNDYFFIKQSELKVTMAGSFTSVIFNRMIATFYSGDLWRFIQHNFINYTQILLASMFPMLILFFLSIRKKSGLYYWALLLFIILNILVTLMYRFSAPHYILNVSTIILLLAMFYLNSVSWNNKAKNLVLTIAFLYQFSLCLELVYAVNFKTDPRIEARQTLLGITNSEDVIAVEYYMVNGFPLAECSNVLLEKSRIIQQQEIGSGETFRLQSERPDTNCRKIIAIHRKDIYIDTPKEGEWILTRQNFHTEKQVDYLVKTSPASGNKIYNSYILNNFEMYSRHEFNFLDPRLKVLALGEYFFSPRYIYKKNN